MAARDPAEAVLAAKIAAAERWGRTPDRSAATEPARAGLRAKFEREADPEDTLPAGERARRADHLMQAHMLRMSLAARRNRRKAREHLAEAERQEAAFTQAGGGPSAA